MGATTVSRIVHNPDVNEAWEEFSSDGSWYNVDENCIKPGFCIVEHPHISVGQAEQNAGFRIQENEDKWAAWSASPVGETRTTQRVVKQELTGHPKDIFTRYIRIESLDSIDLEQKFMVEFAVEEHHPVGKPLGWCFYGWVNT